MRRHAVRTVKYDRDAEITLNGFYKEGWVKEEYFYENGNHIMVFSIDIKEELDTVSEEKLSIFDEFAVKDVFSSS